MMTHVTFLRFLSCVALLVVAIFCVAAAEQEAYQAWRVLGGAVAGSAVAISFSLRDTRDD